MDRRTILKSVACAAGALLCPPAVAREPRKLIGFSGSSDSDVITAHYDDGSREPLSLGRSTTASDLRRLSQLLGLPEAGDPRPR